jgi:allantoicase
MSFTDLPDLAAEELGGAVLWANDEFFAEKENLLKAAPAEWREHEYTPRGKWMDGWETRRRREPGFDSCILRLGLSGVIKGVVVDTAFFRGNFPSECSLEGGTSENGPWTEILVRSPLQGNAKNLFDILDGNRYTHLRFHIYPDGGVARLRVHGEVVPDFRGLLKYGGLIDLAALENGARSLECSDMFFGNRNNLLLPGRPINMSSGWETKRRRGPGHDWNLVKLGNAGLINRVEIDTTHFKGNAPGWAMIEASLDGVSWRELLPRAPLRPHERKLFEPELRSVGLTHFVRLNVYPDGGVARLRVWGEVPQPEFVIDRDTLQSLCGSSKWIGHMEAAAPFEDAAAFRRIAEKAFWKLSQEDLLEAFAAHPRIGVKGHSEQSGVQDSDRVELAKWNDDYFNKFGFVFLICASGRSGAEMLAALQQRLGNSREEELRTAAEEQAKILRLRIERLLNS